MSFTSFAEAVKKRRCTGGDLRILGITIFSGYRVPLQMAKPVFSQFPSLALLPDSVDGAEQMGLNSSELQRSRVGNFFQAHFLNEAQDEDRALLWREFSNGRPDSGHFLAS
jgi:uncharacterized membrane protein